MKKYKLDGDTQREFTVEEYEQAAIDEANWQAELEAKAQIEAKRLAALAKLEALGLDEDDLKALGL